MLAIHPGVSTDLEHVSSFEMPFISHILRNCAPNTTNYSVGLVIIVGIVNII